MCSNKRLSSAELTTFAVCGNVGRQNSQRGVSKIVSVNSATGFKICLLSVSARVSASGREGKGSLSDGILIFHTGTPEMMLLECFECCPLLSEAGDGSGALL